MLAPDARYCKAFLEVPIVSFKKGKSLKYLLVRAKVPVEKETEGKFCGCQGKNCEVCTFQKKKTRLLTKRVVIHIREGLHLDCNSEKVMYLITCKKCQKQYVGSCITRFGTRFNKYPSCHRKFCRGHSVIQVSFQAHFIIDEERNKQETKKSNSKSNKIV